MTLQALTAPQREAINRVLEEQLQLIASPAARLHEAMRYALVLGGKRVRPFLTYAVGDICSAPRTTLDLAAAAVECIHAYSLIHDDLPAMDDDDLRRGQPTCHKAFDEATAILAGDALQTLAFELLSNAQLEVPAERQLRMLQVLSRASGSRGMCGGQALDLAATGQHLSEAELSQVHQLKTGALIEAAVQLGVLAGNDDAQQYYDDFTDFAAWLGLAFQVQDDILDVTSSTETLGKTNGKDEAANKSTYVQLLGLEQAQVKLAQLHQKALQALQRIPYNTQLLEKFAEQLLNRDH
ncbi:(2E,6E)-farnesyl diphosphate synthase [Pseudidiomarina homiensis]|uniref:(2E,6E)-farnesyl diphosphate synthase n=1 Tax=Pseudidiomarina homiensis TaxID=364198 RepID=A0A432XUR3_9GAMM|nr:farnesyl diphosphate synthase [Pseudidiomarina homiensis]RUO52331.1 (2E,6E)-farnesyl diphosphate synthase [Pseudidiomarina homiensis]